MAAEPTTWFDPIKAADAELVVSELVTNAVLFARGPIACAVALDAGVLRIELSDAGPVAPDVGRRDLGHGDLPGRGLAIVDALSLDWGIRTAEDHQTVWALVPLQ